MKALAVFGIWTAYGLLLFIQMRLNRPATAPAPWQPWGPALFWMSSAWIWAVLTPGIVLLVRRAPPTAFQLRRIAPHIAALAVAHIVVTLVDAVTFYFVSKQFSFDPVIALRRGFASTLLLYSAVVLAVLALDHARLARDRAVRATQLEADLTRAHLETLRRQLQPHFLFNTLNTIAELIDTDPARAGEMVARLGELLRHSLDQHERRLIPLAAELEFVRLYAEIEQVRFESWLDIKEEVERATMEAWVPPMILQPLVENAIKHGISPSGRKGTIAIRALRVDDRLRLEVQDDGVGLNGNGKAGTGLGLKTTRERLAHQFGPAATLDVRPEQPGTLVRLDLPFVTKGGPLSIPTGLGA